MGCRNDDFQQREQRAEKQLFEISPGSTKTVSYHAMLDTVVGRNVSYYCLKCGRILDHTNIVKEDVMSLGF